MGRVQITVVEDTFSLGERGVVATGVWLDETQQIPDGAPVEVVCPDGATFRTTLRGASPFTNCFGERPTVGLLFGGLSDKSQIPLGSEVWLVGNQT